MIWNFKQFQKYCEKPKRLSTKLSFIAHQCYAYIVSTFPTPQSHISSFILLKQVKQSILHSNTDNNQPSFLVSRGSFVKRKLLRSAI